MALLVNNKLPAFGRTAVNLADDALAELASDALRGARERAPFQKGALRRESHAKKIKQGHFQVSFWMEYARFQEFGGNAAKRVRQYSATGTGAHYLRNAGDAQLKRFGYVMKKHLGRFGRWI
jgi:hypothetical protein